MTELLLSRRDLDSCSTNGSTCASLTAAARFADHGRETFDAVLDTGARLADGVFAPHYQKADRNEPRFDGERVQIIDEVKAALEALASTGLMSAAQDYALGGMQLPKVVEVAATTYLYAANVGTSAYRVLTMGNAELLLAHGSPAQIKAFVEPRAGRPLLRHDVPVRAAGRLVAVGHHHARRTGRRFAVRPALPRHRQQDVDLGRRPRALREHRAPGPGQGSGRRRQADSGRAAAFRCSSCRSSWSTRTAASANATTSSWPASTTRWAIAARSTACSISAKARAISPKAGPARSAIWSATCTRAWPACST